MDDQQTPTNDLNAAVTKFCLALEKDRRTPEGRIRSEREFREHFFPYDDASSRDRILKFLPREIRGPIVASWGIRGRKAAMRDDDSRVRAVVHDAFVAGDIDDGTFEEGVSSDVVVTWGELADWWKFWRGGKQTKYSIQRALEQAYDLALFDARWFFGVLESGGGKLHGTDVLVEGMSKTELADWIKKIHESGDGSPRGLLTALGWSTLVAKTSNAVLLSAIDAFAQKNGLVKDKFKADEGGEDSAPMPSRRPSDEASSPPAKEAVSARRPSVIPSWSEGLSAPPEAPPKEDVVLSPPDDALLKELEMPSRPEDDWLDNPVSVPSEATDDLDVVIDSAAGSLQPDPAEVTTVFQRSEDDLFGPGGGGAEPGTDGGVAVRSKATLPGLPISPRNKTKTVPPPLPDKGRKH
ncbi:MAG TPA: hypothetical protein VJT73_01390 [Polyangiaceae bacterium]|nr:hypothetical protein [Polyangiaceae bacterium]